MTSRAFGDVLFWVGVGFLTVVLISLFTDCAAVTTLAPDMGAQVYDLDDMDANAD